MKKIIGILFLSIFYCCQYKSEKKFEKLEKMNWLIGNWEQKLTYGILNEIWTKENDSTFSAVSYFINSKDTMHFETIKLTQLRDNLIYSTKVIGQNNDEFVDFKLTSDTENAFTFENSSLDYPKKITYKKVSSDRMITVIFGKQQGKDSQESYPMKKK